MARYYYRPWKDETLISALHFLRCKIVRDGLRGQMHVDALLRQLGADPNVLEMPRKTPKRFRKGERRRAILEALRDGPKTGAEVTRVVMERASGLTYRQAYKRVYATLCQEVEGRKWATVRLSGTTRSDDQWFARCEKEPRRHWRPPIRQSSESASVALFQSHLPSVRTQVRYSRSLGDGPSAMRWPLLRGHLLIRVAALRGIFTGEVVGRTRPLPPIRAVHTFGQSPLIICLRANVVL